MHTFFSIQQAAESLGVSAKTLRRWEERGVLVPLRSEGGHRRYKKSQIDRFGKTRDKKNFAKEQKLIAKTEAIEKVPTITPSVAQSNSKQTLAVPSIPFPSRSIDTVQSVPPTDVWPFTKNSNEKVELKIEREESQLRISNHKHSGKQLRHGAIAILSLVFLVKLASSVLAQHQELTQPLDWFLSQILAKDVQVLPPNSNKRSLALSKVLGDSTISNDLIFKLNVPVEFNNISTFQAPVTVNSDIGVSGEASISAGLRVEGPTSLGVTVIRNTLNVTGAAQFGNITRINGVNYSFPTAQANSVKFLQNNGLGTLSWSDVTVPTQLSELTGTLSISNGGTNNSTAYSTGSVIFSDGSKLTQDNANFFWDAGNHRLGIGNAAPTAPLSVGSSSQFQVDSGGAIAAATGITSSGSVTFSGLNTAGALVYTNSSGVLGVTAQGSSGECLVSAGSVSPIWTSCAAASGSLWSASNGAIYPINSTYDFLVGSDASASAKFAVLNVNSGTPVASVSAGVNGATYMTADGTIATTDLQNLTLGSSTTTQNILLRSLGNVGIGTLTPGVKLDTVVTDSATSTVTDILRLTHRSTGSPGSNGFGGGLAFNLDNDANSSILSGHIYSNWYDQRAGLEQGRLNFSTYNRGAENLAMTISTGRVGINTSNPSSILDVRGSTNSTNQQTLTIDGNISFDAFVNNPSGVNKGLYWYGAGATGGTTAYGSIYREVSTGKMFIDSQSTMATVINTISGGNVGIGDTSPASLFTVGNNDPFQVDSSGNIVKLNNVTTSFPSAQGAAGTVLTNDGAGTLSWVGGSGTGTAGFWTHTGTNLSPANIGDSVGIGNATPNGKLDVTDTSNTAASFSLTNNTATTIGAGVNTLGVLDLQSTSLTTGNFLNVETNALTSGKALNVTSTSTALSTGSLGVFDWSPGTATTATGDLLSVNVGANGIVGSIFSVKNAGSSVFSVGQSQITAALPTQFTSPGDVSFGYDIQFTNPVASYIKSAAPLYVQAGETFNSSNLTLKTFNSGQVVLDSPGGVSYVNSSGTSMQIIDSSGRMLGSLGGSTTNYFAGTGAGNTTLTGTQNIGIGSSAGAALTSGTGNVMIGYQAGLLNSSGGTNTLIGNSAGAALTTNNSQTFIGYQAGMAATSGTSNTFVGYISGKSITTAGFNTFLGYGTGSAATNNAAGNTLVGYFAGGSITSGASNTVMGDVAGANITTGGQSVLIGDSAGNALSTVGTQTFVGYAAGLVNTSGASNTFIGYQSGRGVTTNGFNTFVGYNTGISATNSGINNTFMGYNAGTANTSGSSSTAIGYQAGVALTTGGENTLLGVSAGAAVTTGARNVFIGNQAGAAGGTGVGDSVMIGYQSGRVNTGSNNLFIGFQSASANTSGTQNVFLGWSSGANNLTGGANTYVGFGSGANSTGGNNTFVGNNAGANNTSDFSVLIGSGAGAAVSSTGTQTFIGYQAGAANTTGVNTYIGYQAGKSNTTGTANTLLGYQTGVSATFSGSSNTLIGYQAGTVMTSGADNVFVGQGAGVLATTSTGSVVIGKGAGASLTTLGLSTFVGYQAGAAVSSGSGGTFVGYQAGAAVTTGTNNTFMGQTAGSNNQTGANNTALGYQAGGANAGGVNSFSNLTALGSGAGTHITTGTDNTFLGYQAGAAVTTDAQNTFVGSEAGLSQVVGTFGGRNSYLGYQAGRGNVTGYGNVAIGWQAGLTATGNTNTFVGYGSGGGAANSGTQNVLVGTNAGVALTSASTVTAIGNAAGTNLTTGGANTFVGAGAGNAVTTGAGNVAIGDTAFGSGQNTALRNVAIGGGSVLWNYAANSGALVDNVYIGYGIGAGFSGVDFVSGAGNVIIGSNATPAITSAASSVLIGYQVGAALTSTGSQTFIGYQAGTANTSGVNTFVGYQSGKSITTQTRNTFLGYNTGAGASNTGSDNTFVGYQMGVGATSGGENTFIGSNVNGISAALSGAGNTAVGASAGVAITSGVGNTFIGRSAGTATTDATGNVAIGYSALQNNVSGASNVAIGLDTAQNVSGSENVFIGRRAGNTQTTGAGNIAIGYAAGLRNQTGTGNTTLGYLGGGGSVGSTNNYSNSTYIGYQSGTAGTTASNNAFLGYNSGLLVTTGGTNTLLGAATGGSLVSGTGNVFIGYQAGGTETGSNKLYIANSNTTTPLIGGDFSTNTVTLGNTGSVLDLASATNGNTFITKIPQKATTGTCASAAAEGMIYQNTGGTQVGHICIDGPGSGTPDKLRFYAEQFNATSTDLAENYSDVGNVLGAADVVMLDESTIKGVQKATDAKQDLLLGVVSTSPGVTLTGVSENGQTDLVNPKAIALSGRVPVKIASNSQPIRKGDFLTVSGEAGRAAKATESGYSLGRALEDWTPNSGQNTILTFVNLTWFDYDYTLTSNKLDQYNLIPGGSALAGYLLQTPIGVTVDRVVTASTALIANINAGSITAKSVTADKIDTQELTIAGISLDQYITQVLASQTVSSAPTPTPTPTPVASSSGTLAAPPVASSSSPIVALQATASAQLILSSLDSIQLNDDDIDIQVSAATINHYIKLNGSAYVGDTLGVQNSIVLGQGLALSDRGFDFTDVIPVAQRHLSLLGSGQGSLSILNGILVVNDQGKVIVNGSLEVTDHLTLGQDHGGFAKIKTGDTEVNITFAKPYDSIPVITATADQPGLAFGVKNKTATGFTIYFTQATNEDQNFTWTAIQIKNAQTSVSDGVVAGTSTSSAQQTP